MSASLTRRVTAVEATENGRVSSDSSDAGSGEDNLEVALSAGGFAALLSSSSSSKSASSSSADDAVPEPKKQRAGGRRGKKPQRGRGRGSRGRGRGGSRGGKKNNAQSVHSGGKDAGDKTEAVDEVEQALRELGLESNVHTGESSEMLDQETEYGGASDLLAVDVSRLDPEDELMRVFGRDTVRQVQRDARQDDIEALRKQVMSISGLTARQRKEILAREIRERRARQSLQQRRESTSSSAGTRLSFVEPRDAWPSRSEKQAPVQMPSGAARSSAQAKGTLDSEPPPPGFDLVPITSAPGSSGSSALAFRIAWGTSYRNCQELFFQCERTHNPATLQGLIQQHNWWHVDSLLRLSDVCRLSGDNDAAVDFLHRAIYSLQTAWQRCPNASAEALNARRVRIPFFCSEEVVTGPERDANKPLYSALLHHAMQLSREGCSRTALEVCKVLLLLDWPDDPVCAWLAVDVFALKSRELDWLLKLCLDPSDCIKFVPYARQMTLLPNFAFSVALALRWKEKDSADDNSSPLPSGLGDMNSSVLLQRAICKFPGVVSELAENHDMATTLGKTDDGTMLGSHAFFSSQASDDGVDTKLLQQLVKLYASRSAALWKTAETAAWFRENCHAVISASNGGAGDSAKRDLDKLHDQALQAFSADPEKCSPLVHHIRQNIYSHLLLTETAESVVAGALPQDIVAELQQGAGGVALYENWQEHRDEYAGDLPVGAGGNALGLFLNSLITPHHSVGADGEPVSENWLDTLVGLFGRAAHGQESSEDEEDA